MLDQSRGGCAQVLSQGGFIPMDKFIWIRDMVTLGLLHPDALVIATDCSDKYLMCGAAEIECKFEALAKEPGTVVSSAVKRGAIRNPYPPSRTGMRYANSGQLLGRAKDIGAFFNRMRREWAPDGKPDTRCCPASEKYVLPGGARRNATECCNDQRCTHTYVAAGFHTDGLGPSLEFDHVAEMFLVLGRVSNRVTIGRTSSRDVPRVAFNLSQALAPTTGPQREQVWRAEKAYTTPCWIHGAGAGKSRFIQYVRQLQAQSAAAVGPPLPDPRDTELQRCCRRVASRARK
ncbi:hypothetical protein T492DRAFT_930788 [Pavlovales sp. CCMP2436]|nr:hypothetical protein T492DRAFT_930788 [Pavlovales sp. CCMP2436]